MTITVNYEYIKSNITNHDFRPTDSQTGLPITGICKIRSEANSWNLARTMFASELTQVRNG